MKDVWYVVPDPNETKFEKVKREAKNKAREFEAWWDKNKYAVVVFGSMVIGGLGSIAKVLGKNANLRKEETLKTKFCYDTSLGKYWELSRKLTNKEWLEIDRRRSQGERLGTILESLNALK